MSIIKKLTNWKYYSLYPTLRAYFYARHVAVLECLLIASKQLSILKKGITGRRVALRPVMMHPSPIRSFVSCAFLLSIKLQSLNPNAVHHNVGYRT